jgi:EAL domain-containing protein (putative c-di-GMP-specific phosphodiesterase class I)
VRRILDVAALPPHRLQLLVEDDVLMALDPDQIEELDNLVRSGVAVLREQRGGGRFDALSDPGVPLGGLRVDGSVVRGLDESAGEVVRSAVEGMLAWAVETLEMELVARGVRSGSEAAALTELGVDAAQGPFFGEELTADEVRALLEGPS